jgi:hypothetical protein
MGALLSPIELFAAGDRFRLVGSIALPCNQDVRTVWNGGLDAFARPSSQHVGLGRADTLLHCSSRDAPRG